MDQGFQNKEIKLRTGHSEHKPSRLTAIDGKEPDTDENTRNS